MISSAVLLSITTAMAAAASEAAESTDLASTMAPEALAALAIGLVLVAAALIILEFFVISGGIISALAAMLAVGGIILGFEVGNGLGWGMLLLTPVLFIVCVRVGLRRLQSSPLVTQSTVDGDAGYRQFATRFGIAAGSIGVMVTNAMPTGRCRFDGGEADVAMNRGSAKVGQQVRVLRIDGPTIYVAVHTDSSNEVAAATAATTNSH